MKILTARSRNRERALHFEKRSLASGVFFMTLSGLVVKAAGLVFKIPLTALLGEAGMGYFNGAYTLFAWLYMLLAAGLPTAASMMISRLPENRKMSGAARILRVSLTLFTMLGLLASVLFCIGAGWLSSLMRVEESRLSMLAIAPTLFFICQSAALRGYFQGFGDLRWHSLSQVIEALGKAGLGVALAHHAIKEGKSVPEAAAWAAAGITIGVAAGMCLLYFAWLVTDYRRKSGETDRTPYRDLAKNLWRAALPITLSSSVMSLAGLVDTFIMTRCLHASGLSQAETAAIYGNYTSLAVPMFNLPPILSAPIAYALLPALGTTFVNNKIPKAHELTNTAARLTAIIAMPCAVGMSTLAEPILALFFDDGVASRGAAMLTLLAPASFLLCMLGLMNAVLQACGHERVPLAAMLVGAAVKLTATWVLTPIIGRYAAPLSTAMCYIVVAVISAAAIAKLTPLGSAFGIGIFIKPLIASGLSVVSAAFLQPIIGKNIGTLCAVAAAAITYAVLIGISEYDLIRRFLKGSE